MDRQRVAVVVALALAGLAAPVTASAGFVVGARVGWAFPFGELRNGVDLDSAVRGQIPLQVDLGWRFADRLMLGGYARLSPGVVGDNVEDACDASSLDCDGPFGWAVGGQVDVRLAPGNAGPWIGAFGGFEALTYGDVSEAVDTDSLELSYEGWEVGAQGGIDFAWGPIVIGPWASVSWGRFTEISAEIGGRDTDIPEWDEATHTWVQVGLRGALDF
ncbi:hypothetical protein [Anaeromyxobacter sp. Fw109-5]|uniref:hypothetical protein n=1 Tax=Anaeromyxobacter sp. (strain Fw109-5) TaxID=404589 RepID=UPI0000ED78F2|nr:hypothetical protein [Anaeromyxobacter sp. Fw109-5]ABS24380.1 hypothetical protein Anae109_0162 [Anaeromyxobacter sp. Fw109-5]